MQESPVTVCKEEPSPATNEEGASGKLNYSLRLRGKHRSYTFAEEEDLPIAEPSSLSSSNAKSHKPKLNPYLRKLKQHEKAGTLEEFKSKERARSKRNRTHISEEKRKHRNHMQSIRQARYRERLKQKKEESREKLNRMIGEICTARNAQDWEGLLRKDDDKKMSHAAYMRRWRQIKKYKDILKSQGFALSGPRLKTKAEELSVAQGIQNWRCSDGWLSRWKKRHGVAVRSASNDQASVDRQPEQPADNPAEAVLPVSCNPPTTERWVEEVLQHTLQWYEPRNIFNMGVSALFWRLLPTRTPHFKREKCCRGEKSKERLTVLLCCNMDGSEKMPLFAVGKFKNPQCFMGVKTLPVQYRANPKAWMTADLFQEWLRSFDSMMAKQNRKVLLVLDSCPTEAVPALKASEILLLPDNPTLGLHPCDLGIIDSLKVHYRNMKVLKLLAHTNAGGAAQDYSFSLADAACTLKCAWDRVSPSTIRSCFRRACFKVGEAGASADDSPDECERTENEAQEALLSKVFEGWNVSPLDYFRVDDGVATTGPVKSVPCTTTPSQSTSSVSLQTSVQEEVLSDEDEDCGKGQEKVSSKTVLDSVRTIQTFCMQAGCDSSVMNSFNTFVQALDRHLGCASYQTKITQFFSKGRGIKDNQQGEQGPRIVDSYNWENGRREAEELRSRDGVPSSKDIVCMEDEGVENMDSIVIKVENAEDDFEYRL